MGLGIVFIAFFLLFVGIAVYLNSDIENHKHPSFAVANDFMNCLYDAEDAAKCINNFVHQSDKKDFRDDDVRKLAELLKRKLGKRGASGSNDDSWSMTSTMNTDKSNESLISFTAKTMYQNDLAASEKYAVKLVDGKYYLKKAHVDSKAFYK